MIRGIRGKRPRIGATTATASAMNISDSSDSSGRSNRSTALGRVREFFLLRQAERTIKSYETGQEQRVRAHAVAAEQRLAAARRVWQSVPAAALLLEAVRHYLRALKEAQPAGGRPPDGDLASSLPALPPDAARPEATPSDDERVRAALTATDSLYLDRMTPEEAALTRTALERAASALGGHVEARSLAHVRGSRWGRVAAVVILALYAGLALARAVLLPRNVARDKPVHPSSSRHGDGHELVDGEVDTVPGVLTGMEESPSAVIDLVAIYAVDEVRVYNRIDQSFDDCLPLAVEVSLDGATYKEVGRRDQHFAADPPWIVPVHHEVARFVRVRVLRRGYLALSEVEVFGKKQKAR
jgi:hypothetical protein